MAGSFLKYNATLFPLPCNASVDFQYMLLWCRVTGNQQCVETVSLQKIEVGRMQFVLHFKRNICYNIFATCLRYGQPCVCTYCESLRFLVFAHGNVAYLLFGIYMFEICSHFYNQMHWFALFYSVTSMSIL